MKKLLLIIACVILCISLAACDFGGSDGADDKTPYIENGYWYIDGVNTGVKAEVDICGSENHPHTYGDWRRYTFDENVSCDAWLYYSICSECENIKWKNGGADNHSFEIVTVSPTCVSQGYDIKTCTVCGLIEKTNYTAISGHSYEKSYSYSDSSHWLDCKHCDATTSYAEHNIDDSGFCTVCNQPLASTEGIVYDLSKDGSYAEVIAYSGNNTRISIADTYKGVPVTNIYNEAFKDNKKITTVVIPDSVTSIGWDAFYNCISLTSVTMPDSVTNIGYEAFAYCYSLTSVTIGDGVTSIGERAFESCTSLTSITIPDSVTSIGERAFMSCTSLTSVTIPDGVTRIGNYAFEYCTSLTSVTIGDSVTSIGERAFFGCNSALYTEYECGKYVGDENNPYAVLIEVTNKNLSTYTINENTKIIAYEVFTPCERLTSIDIPDGVICIGSHAFAYCYSLTSVTIGDSVTSIGYGAFSVCTSLTSVTIGDSVTSIGYGAFSNCSSLKSITIPDSVTSIGSDVFLESSSFSTINYKGTEEEWNAISKGSSWDSDYYTINYNYTEE